MSEDRKRRRRIGRAAAAGDEDLQRKAQSLPSDGKRKEDLERKAQSLPSGGKRKEDLRRKGQSLPSDGKRKEDLEGKAKRKEDVIGKDPKRRRRIGRAAASAGEEDLQRKVQSLPSDGKRKKDLDVEERDRRRRWEELELLHFDGIIKEPSDAEKELQHRRDMENREYVMKNYFDKLDEETEKKRYAEMMKNAAEDSDFDMNSKLPSDSEIDEDDYPLKYWITKVENPEQLKPCRICHKDTHRDSNCGYLRNIPRGAQFHGNYCMVCRGCYEYVENYDDSCSCGDPKERPSIKRRLASL